MTADRPAIVELLARQLACPVCNTTLPALDRGVTQLDCSRCGARYAKGQHVFDLTPPASVRDGSEIWKAWDQIQANGLSGYTADPIRNLSVGERADCRSFGKFAACRGLVLDVGCGPQAWPAYYERSPDIAYVGIDPFADLEPADFVKFVGLGEFMPFADSVFDHVMFATTLDHFVAPVRVLEEAARVAKPSGSIEVWLGETDTAAPKPKESPEWYRRLTRPALADDLFHIKRLNHGDFLALVDRAGLRVHDRESHRVDPYRVNNFYRLQADK
jgi:SAM-dependent methyltransferase